MRTIIIPKESIHTLNRYLFGKVYAKQVLSHILFDLQTGTQQQYGISRINKNLTLYWFAAPDTVKVLKVEFTPTQDHEQLIYCR
jgi:hypothetical protein